MLEKNSKRVKKIKRAICDSRNAIILDSHFRGSDVFSYLHGNGNRYCKPMIVNIDYSIT